VRGARMSVVVLVGFLAGGALAAPSTAEPVGRAPASPIAAPVPGCDDPDTPIGDLDGDGVPEVVVGMPTFPGGGAVDVRYTGGGGAVVTATTLGVWASRTTDRFGAAVVVSELNGDRCADLVIGSPGHAGTGAVVIALGSPQGWSPSEASLVPTPTKKVGAEVGAALAVFTSFEIGGPSSVLAVGMPGYPVNGHPSAGAVVGYPIPGGVLGAPVTVTQDTAGVAGTAEAGDRLGAQLTADGNDGLLAGMPLEDVGGRQDAGILMALGLRDGRWSGAAWSEDTPGVPGVAEAGDHFGAAVVATGAPFDVNYVQMTIGVPGEDIGARRDVGTAVSVIATGEDLAVLLLHQDGAWQGQPVPGVGASGDHFGASLAQRSGPRGIGVVVGTPGKDVSGATDAGAVVTFDSNFGQPSTMSVLTEADVSGGHVEVGDRFAAALTSGWTQESDDPPSASGSRLVVGIPGEDVRGARDAGALAFGDSLGPLRAVTTSAGARAGLAYGSVLGRPSVSF
jgi:FG-GAP repeat protein